MNKPETEKRGMAGTKPSYEMNRLSKLDTMMALKEVPWLAGLLIGPGLYTGLEM